jgi:putative aldouronate transport system substrate-binding protein
MKKSFSLVTVVLSMFCFSVNVFAGGSQADSAVNAVSSAEDPSMKELRIMIRSIGMAPTNDNLINKELEKKTGFKLNWDLKPGNGYNEAQTAVLASGDYPDAMEWIGNYPNGLQELADDKVIRPVDDLVAKYGTNFLDPNVRGNDEWFVSDTDGKRYAIQARHVSFAFDSLNVIRKDWLDKLGLPLPRSSDEYFNVLTAFAKNSDKLVGPGKAIIPMGTWAGQVGYFINYLLSENGIHDGWNTVNGKLVNVINMDGYKNALLTARRFYQAGLIEPEYPIMANRDDAMKKMMDNQYASWTWYINDIDAPSSSLATTIMMGNPDLVGNLVFVPIFKAKDGKPHYVNSKITNQMVIFSKTPEGKAVNIVKLLNYMVSEEGFVLVQNGIEGFSYTRDSNGQIIGKDMTREQTIELGFKNYYLVAMRDYMPPSQPKYVWDFAASELQKKYGVERLVAVGNTWRESGPALTDLKKQYETRLITEKNTNFDALFQEYVDKWNAQGGAKVTQEMNEYYGKK